MKVGQIIIGVLIGVAIMAAVWYIVTPSGKVSREGFQQPAATATPKPATPTPAIPVMPGVPVVSDTGALFQTCSIMKSIHEQVKSNYEKAKSLGNLPENVQNLQMVLDTMAAELAKNNCT